MGHMSEREIENFYRELDKRMNQSDPDDDIDHYLRRMGVVRRSRDDLPLKSIAEHAEAHAQSDTAPRVLQSAREKGEVNQKMSDLGMQELKSGTLSNDVSVAKTDESHYEVQNVLNPEKPSLGTEFTHLADRSDVDSREEKTNTESDLSTDPISSFSKTSVNENLIAVNPRQSEIVQGTKRKLPEVGANLPTRKRISRQPSIDEITSFISSEKPQSISVPVLPIPRQKVANQRTGPTLDLRPIVPPDPITNLPASPIEDAIPEHPREDERSENGARGGTSDLYLEVASRIAQHTRSKKKEKEKMELVRLGQRQLESEATIIIDDSSSIIVDSSSNSTALVSSGSKADATKYSEVELSSSSSKPASRKNAKKAKGKEKSSLVTPVEYALKLQDQVTVLRAKTTSRLKGLAGLTIFYTGGDRQYASQATRNRMELVVKHGGNLVPEYDPSAVTHIVTDADRVATLHSLGLKRLKDIPEYIPTVRWKWVITRMGKEPMTPGDLTTFRPEELWLNAAFSERMDAGLGENFSYRNLKGMSNLGGKGKAKTAKENEDVSRISEFTVSDDKSGNLAEVEELVQVKEHGEFPEAPLSPPPSPPPRPRVSPTKNSGGKHNGDADDPLAEFYAQARAEHECGWSKHDGGESDVSSDAEVQAVSNKPQKRGWTCDMKEVQQQTCANQDIVDKLKELQSLHEVKPTEDDRWRVLGYNKCIRALKNYPKRIESFAEARSIRGVGEKTAAKIMEIVETGSLRRIGYEKTQDVETTKLFQGIYGVGQTTAYQWYCAGCRTLEDLVSGKFGVKLSTVQEIGIKYCDDINDRMPREEAKEIFDLIKPIALNIEPKLFIEIMGSYRRGKDSCGDIDILITRPIYDGKTHKGVIAKLLRELHVAGILTEDLAVPENLNDLEAIYRGLCRVPNREGAKRRRIDFLAVPWQWRGSALLYYTGDAIFNRAIRLKANRHGYSLNHKGLFEGVVRNPRDGRSKVNGGNCVASETEEEIFKILNVPWQEPHERVRGG